MYVKGIITVTNRAAQGAAANNRKKGVICKNCAPFINCISRINNAQVDDAHDIDASMLMHILLEYSNIYPKTSGSLCQCYRDESVLNDNKVIIDFPAKYNNSNLFKFKHEITGQTNNDGIKDVEIMFPLKYE